jgi:hypothetical protein
MAFRLHKHLFTGSGTAIPRPCPIGGIFHIIPISGAQLNRVLKSITRITYLTDGKGKTVFVKEGNGRRPIQKNEKNTEAMIEEALQLCSRIDEVEELDVDSAGNVTGSHAYVDAEAKAQDLPDGTIVSKEIRRAMLSVMISVPSPASKKTAAAEESLPVPEDEAPAATEVAGEQETIVADDVDNDAAKASDELTLLCAEWVLNEALELGEAQKVKAEKNS